MRASLLKPASVQADADPSPAPSLRSIVRKSLLLNLVIVATSFPVLTLAGGPDAVAPALAIMVGISVVIWTATFTLFSLVSLVRIFRRPISTEKRLDLRVMRAAGVSDRWLDGPI